MANTTLAANATGTLVNTATVTASNDPNTANNGATDTDTIILPPANLSISKARTPPVVYVGDTVTYNVGVLNMGPGAVTGASVIDSLPAVLTGVSWTCTAGSGGTCGTASGIGNLNTTVNLLSNGSVVFTISAKVPVTASGALVNTATVAPPPGVVDPDLTNNSATDTTQIQPRPLPTLTTLDNFNRTSASTLNAGAPAGVNWSQTTGALTVIRVNTNQANCALVGNCLLGSAIWNGTTNIFGTKQSAAFTFTSTPAAALFLKASGGSANAPASYIRVRPVGTQILVETTTNSGSSYTTQGTFAAVNFVSGDRLTAVANADGSVDVWKTTSTNVTTYVGHSSPVAGFTGGGRIGMQLLVSASVDNFAGGTLP
jgi:uncharacterized repeat protein (TIGR01451 family)